MTVSSPTPNQTLIQTSEALAKAKADFDVADQALTVACKAYAAALDVTQTFVPDYAARCSR